MSSHHRHDPLYRSNSQLVMSKQNKRAHVDEPHGNNPVEQTIQNYGKEKIDFGLWAPLTDRL